MFIRRNSCAHRSHSRCRIGWPKCNLKAVQHEVCNKGVTDIPGEGQTLPPQLTRDERRALFHRLHTNVQRNVTTADEVLAVVEKCHRWQLLKDPRDWVVAISALGRAGLWEQALDMLEAMRQERLVAVHAFNATMSAFEKCHRWPAAIQLYGDINRYELQPDVVTCNALLSAYDRGGHWPYAVAFLDEMVQGQMANDRLQPNVVTYSTVISGCERGRAWKQALKVFSESSGIDGDTVIFNAALSACDRGSLWLKALDILAEMHKVGVPGAKGYSACAGFKKPDKEFFLDLKDEGGCLQWGQDAAQGPLVLCLHAASLCSGVWAPLASRIVPESIVVACDLRGHGRSDAPSGRAHYSWHAFGEDFVRLLHAVSKLHGRCPAACITHSFAGDTALIGLAARPTSIKLLMLDPVLANAEGATTGAERLAKGTRRLGEKEAHGFEVCWIPAEAKAAFAAYGSYNDNGRWRLLCRRENEAEVYMNRIALADYLSEKEVSAEVHLVLSSKRRAKPEDQESALLRDQQQAEKVNSLTEQNSPPQGGALPVNVVSLGEGSAAQSSPWVPTLPNPREIPVELQGILGRPQRFNIGDSSEMKAPGVEVFAAEQSEQAEPAKPKEPMELLAEALKSVIKKPDDDDKPKAKEAETVKLPDFPNPETYRSWKISVREAASDKPDEAFKRVQELYERNACMELLRETGKFLTLDTKILSALSRVAKGDLGCQIINYKESEASANRAVRGRQVLLMFEHYLKTNEEAGSLYSVEDLLKVPLSGDDLRTFIHNWESVIAGLNHQPEETTLRDILLRQLRNSSKLRFDLEVYDRAKEGTEQHTYKYFVKCVKELLARERTRKNRTAIAKAQGARHLQEWQKLPIHAQGRQSVSAPVRKGVRVQKRLSSSATLTGEPFLNAGARFALAASKGDATKRDHWVADERKGTCTRIHQKFRGCRYVPQPEHCPIPIWRLKGNAEARMYGSEGSNAFVEKTYNFKTRDFKDPSERWIGTTTFYLKPKVVKVQFQRPEIIDIAPEGEGWRFIVEKREYEQKCTQSCSVLFGGVVDQSTNCDNRAEGSAVCELRHFSRELLPKNADVLLAVLSEGLLSPLPKRRKGVIAEGSDASSKYYVLGAFQHSDRHGITAATTQYGEVASIVNEFATAKALLPGCSWTSIAISNNEFLSLHCDAANLPGSRNHTMTLGSFSGGLLFLDDPDGEDTWTPPGGGGKVRGCNVVNLARFFSFDARSVRHATQPWTGDRWSITLFSACADNMGFPLPSTSERSAVAKYGIPWTPSEFLAEAHRRPHPAQSHYLPGCLEQAIVKEASEGLHSIAKARTEAGGKQLLVFKEMLASQGYTDASIVDEMAQGFELVGHIPEAGVFRAKAVPATLSPAEVRGSAKRVRSGIIASTGKDAAGPLAQGLYDITIDERDRGWLEGPLDPAELPDHASVSRRFAVEQLSGGKLKLRPIDDLSESLINASTSTVLPFGSAASVSAFCRASHAVWFAAVTLLWFHTTVFFDDFFTVCEKMSANHVNLCLNSFFSLLGWDLATGKDAMFLACARILGVVIDLASEMVVKIYNTSERKEELCKEITSILERGSYTTSVICSLRGRLLFAEGQVFGRACYRHMKTIGDRVKSNRNRKVDRDLKNALEYMRDRVVLGPPRVIQAARAEPLHIFTDASFEPSGFSGLGAVLVDAGSRS
eukprot:s4496_g6.t1